MEDGQNTHNTYSFKLRKMNNSPKTYSQRKPYASRRRENEAWIKRIEKEIKEYSKYSWYDRTLHDKCIKHCQEEIKKEETI